MDSAPDRMETLIADVRRGAPGAADEAFRRLYGEMRRIAGGLFRSQRESHTLQPTALVHEAYVKLLGSAGGGGGAGGGLHVNDRAHFLSLAARAMRQVLINHARDRVAGKRGGGRARERITVVSPEAPRQDVEVLDLHDALEALSRVDERQGRIAELRIFGGLTTAEVAAVVGVSPRTVELDWRLAKTWLAARLGDDSPRAPGGSGGA